MEQKQTIANVYQIFFCVLLPLGKNVLSNQSLTFHLNKMKDTNITEDHVFSDHLSKK